jgi:type IV pilus assembly protein PilE
MTTRRHRAGFTLVEVLVVCAVAGVLAAVVLPGYQAHLTHSRRADAASALMRLQQAQERFRMHHGLYSADFRALQVPASSGEGLYALAVEITGPDSYRATATPVPGRAQAGDRECAPLALEVKLGFAQPGPSPRCWNR